MKLEKMHANHALDFAKPALFLQIFVLHVKKVQIETEFHVLV